jgi:hypothetical protein
LPHASASSRRRGAPLQKSQRARADRSRAPPSSSVRSARGCGVRTGRRALSRSSPWGLITRSLSSSPPIRSVVGHSAIAILRVGGHDNGRRRRGQDGAWRVDGESVMRHSFRRKLGLPSRVFACSLAGVLVCGASALHRRASPDGTAAGAADLTVVAASANADFDSATRAAEETMAVDHLSPGR